MAASDAMRGETEGVDFGDSDPPEDVWEVITDSDAAIERRTPLLRCGSASVAAERMDERNSFSLSGMPTPLRGPP